VAAAAAPHVKAGLNQAAEAGQRAGQAALEAGAIAKDKASEARACPWQALVRFDIVAVQDHPAPALLARQAFGKAGVRLHAGLIMLATECSVACAGRAVPCCQHNHASHECRRPSWWRPGAQAEQASGLGDMLQRDAKKATWGALSGRKGQHLLRW